MTVENETFFYQIFFNYVKRNDMSTTFSQQIISGRLLLLGQKCNISVRFKFEPVTINHLLFVVKILQKCYGRSTSL